MLCYGQHGFPPDIRWDTAACYAFEWSIVIVAHPNAYNKIRGKSNKPGIPRRLGGSSFSRNFNAVNLSALSGALLDDLIHHIGKLSGCFGANDALANAPCAACQWLTFSQEPQRRDAIGLNGCAAV